MFFNKLKEENENLKKENDELKKKNEFLASKLERIKNERDWHVSCKESDLKQLNEMYELVQTKGIETARLRIERDELLQKVKELEDNQ